MFYISFRLNSNLALLSLLVVPFLYYSVGYYSTHIRGRLLTVKGMEGETLSIIHEAVAMLRVIIAFGREDHEHARFREQGEKAIGARIGITVRQAVFSLAVNTTTAIGTALVLGYGTYLALQGRLTIGELLIVVAYIGSVYKPLEARISIDGIDIRTLTLKSLRAQISIVLQEPLLFSSTVADNIRYGRLDA